MSGVNIRQWAEEVDRFCAEAEHMHLLLTSELGKFWEGEAYEACLRESRDNRELVLTAVNAYRAKMEELDHGTGGGDALPSDFLL